MMMPLNPLAAKFSKWSSDEEEEDAFGGTGFGGPFGAPLSLNRSVDLGRDDSITPEPPAQNRSGKKKGSGSRKGSRRRQESPSSDGSPSPPPQGNTRGTASDGADLLPAGLRLPVSPAVTPVKPAAAIPVAETAAPVVKVESQAPPLPPRPDPEVPAFVYVDTEEEGGSWKKPADKAEGSLAVPVGFAMGRKRSPRSRAASADGVAANLETSGGERGEGEDAASASQAAVTPVKKSVEDRADGTPFKPKAELYGLVVPDRPMTPLPPPPPVEEESSDDDEGDDARGEVNVAKASGLVVSSNILESGDGVISKEESLALAIAKEAIMSPKPPVEGSETVAEKKQRRGTWRKSWQNDKDKLKKRESKAGPK